MTEYYSIKVKGDYNFPQHELLCRGLAMTVDEVHRHESCIITKQKKAEIDGRTRFMPDGEPMSKEQFLSQGKMIHAIAIKERSNA